MHHFEEKNSKIFSPEGPHENVSPGPAVGLWLLMRLHERLSCKVQNAKTKSNRKNLC